MDDISRSIGFSITGMLMSLFAFAATFMVALAAVSTFQLALPISELINAGIDFLIYDLVGGTLGGLLGGTNKEHTGALLGGLIMGFLAALGRIIFHFYA